MERAELTCDEKPKLTIQVQFNPTSFKLSRKVNWAEQNPALQPHTLLQYGSGASDTLSVSLLLDSSESKDSVLPEIKRFYALTLPSVVAPNQSMRPPLVSFSWQSFHFRGVVQTLDFEVLAFDESGAAKRATVEVALLGEAFPAGAGLFI
jgi:hypothetical protein